MTDLTTSEGRLADAFARARAAIDEAGRLSAARDWYAARKAASRGVAALYDAIDTMTAERKRGWKKKGQLK